MEQLSECHKVRIFKSVFYFSFVAMQQKYFGYITPVTVQKTVLKIVFCTKTTFVLCHKVRFKHCSQPCFKKNCIWNENNENIWNCAFLNRSYYIFLLCLLYSTTKLKNVAKNFVLGCPVRHGKFLPYDLVTMYKMNIEMFFLNHIITLTWSYFNFKPKKTVRTMF